MSSTATTQATGATAPPSNGPEPLFDHERLDVYRVALEFQDLVPRLVPRRGYAALRDQLDRGDPSAFQRVPGSSTDAIAGLWMWGLQMLAAPTGFALSTRE